MRGTIHRHDDRLADHLLRASGVALRFVSSDTGASDSATATQRTAAHQAAIEAVLRFAEDNVLGQRLICLATTSQTATAIDSEIRIGLEGFTAAGEAVSIDIDRLERAQDLLASLHRSHFAAEVDRRIAPQSAPSEPDTNSLHLHALLEELAGPRGLTEGRSTFGFDDCIAAIAERSPVPLLVPDVIDAARRFVAEYARCVTPDPGADDARFTTDDMLQSELRVLYAAIDWTGAQWAVVDEPTRALVLDQPGATSSTRGMSKERRAALEHLTSSGWAVDVLIGAAGAGKTKLMAAARDIWGAAGIATVGTAPTATARQRLHEKTGIPAVALSLLSDPDLSPMPREGVVIVDEAGAVGTRALDRLIAIAQFRRTKVVLVGDPHQMAPDSAGGILTALTDRLPAVPVISGTRRQEKAWERTALLELRTGDVLTATRAYFEHLRVRAAPPAAAIDLAVERWSDALGPGVQPVDASLEYSAVMVAYGPERVAALNEAARRELGGLGLLGDEISFPNGMRVAIGDRLVSQVTAEYLGLTEGDATIVTGFDRERGGIELTLADSGGANTAVVPMSYFERGEFRHAYAFDVREIQSRKVAHCVYVMGPRATREEAYSALSRGTRRNDIIMELSEPEAVASETRLAEILGGRLHRSGAPRAALDVLHRSLHPPTAERRVLEQISERRDRLMARIATGEEFLAHTNPSRAERKRVEAQLAQDRRQLAALHKRLADITSQADLLAGRLAGGGLHTVHRTFAEFTELNPGLAQKFGDLAEQYSITSTRLAGEEVLADHVRIDVGDGIIFEADFLVRGPAGVYIKEVKGGKGSLTKAQRRGHPIVAEAGGRLLDGNFLSRDFSPGDRIGPMPVVKEVWR